MFKKSLFTCHGGNLIFEVGAFCKLTLHVKLAIRNLLRFCRIGISRAHRMRPEFFELADRQKAKKLVVT